MLCRPKPTEACLEVKNFPLDIENNMSKQNEFISLFTIFEDDLSLLDSMIVEKNSFSKCGIFSSLSFKLSTVGGYGKSDAEDIASLHILFNKRAAFST